MGVPIALMGRHLVPTMLYGIDGSEIASPLLAAVLLLVVAVLAGFLPVRRASKVDPMVALRYE